MFNIILHLEIMYTRLHIYLLINEKNMTVNSAKIRCLFWRYSNL